MSLTVLCLYLLLPQSGHSIKETGLTYNDPPTEDFPFPKLRPWVGMLLSNSFVDSIDHERCRNDSTLLREAFEDKMLWATRMVDASVGEVTGALWGSRMQLGSFDGCLSAGAASPVGARYCLLHLELHFHGTATGAPPGPNTVWNTVKELGPSDDARTALNGAGVREGYYAPGDVLVAQCVPRSCHAAVLEAAARTALAASPAGPSVSVPPQFCTASGDGEDAASDGDLQLPPSYAGNLFWAVLAVLAIVCVAAPSLGWSSWCWRGSLLSLRQPDAPLQGLDLSCLSGIRCLAAMLVVCLHRGLALTMGAHSNVPADQLVMTDAIYAANFRTVLFVDTFFFLSGVLCVVSKIRHGFVKSVVTRCFRIVPVYSVIVLFTVFVLPTLSSGPLWRHRLGVESSTCSNWWWANALFIHNYLGVRNEPQLCLLHSWSVSADMQLFVLSALLRPQRRGWLFLLAALLLSVAAPFLLALALRFPVQAFTGPKMVDEYFESRALMWSYVPTHMHASSYVVGLAVGMLLLRMRTQQSRLSGPLTWLLTGSSVAAVLANIMSSTIMMDPGRPYSAVTAASYISLAPVLWAASLGALVVAMVFGKPTPVSCFLSWQPLVSLSRLTYGVYLTSLMYQIASVAYQRDPKMAAPIPVIIESISDIGISFFLSLILFIIVEAPFRKIAKKFFDPAASNQTTKAKCS